MPGVIACSVLTAWLCTIPAAHWRSQTIRLSASLRAESGIPNPSIRLSIAVADGQSVSRDVPVKTTEWTRTELTLPIGRFEENLTLTTQEVYGRKDAKVFLKDITIATVTAPDRGPSEPDFIEGWSELPAGQHTKSTQKDCLKSSACIQFTSPGPELALLQTLSAAAYRGRTVRFRAALRTQTSGQETARLFLRTGRGVQPLAAEDLPDHLDYRGARNSDWSTLEIVRKIEDDATSLSLGVILTGKGRVWLDQPSLTIDPDTAPPPPDINLNEWPVFPRPTVDDQRRVINLASRHALSYIRDLPNFLCTLRIQREENIRNNGWKPRDTLSVQLGFADRRESYKLFEINSKKTTLPYRSAGGALSEGDFGSLLADIFRLGSAQFSWDHWGVVRGRIVHVYRYSISVAKSEYQLHVGNARGREKNVVSAHHGYVAIDRESNRILHLEQVGDPPKGFPILFTSSTIDYDWNDVGGRKYLLPLHAEVTMGTANMSSFNVTEFRDYRRFGAETQITFDPDPPTESKPSP
jgi:hypothetical protein